jgi:hypothetical protein
MIGPSSGTDDWAMGAAHDKTSKKLQQTLFSFNLKQEIERKYSMEKSRFELV